MSANGLHVVTGGLGYSGHYIVRKLLERGVPTRTITNSTHRQNPFGKPLDVRPMPFHDPVALAEVLRGGSVLYNTYWVRFNHRAFRHATAVGNTLRLFEAAARAGIRRVIHVSITNPSEDSPLEYFRGKAVLERALKTSGIRVRPLRGLNSSRRWGTGSCLIPSSCLGRESDVPIYPSWGRSRRRIVYLDPPRSFR